MNFIKQIFLTVIFFFSGCIAAISIITLVKWGTVRFDDLLIYATTAGAAGSRIKNIFAIAIIFGGSFWSVIGLYAKKYFRLLAVFVSLVLFAHTFQIYNYIKGIESTSNLYEQEYRYPNIAPITAKRNLIVLYLESMEKEFENYDGKGSNLIPELTEIAQENYSFDGFYQLTYANATISAQADGLCAVGYKTELEIADLKAFLNNTLANAVCYSDILASAGYNTYFIKGASLDFSGTGDFMKQHGFAKAEGFDELRKRLNISDNTPGWGINDRMMYQTAKEQILQMSKEQQPFLVMMTTLDTHDPMTLDKLCPTKYGDNRDVIICADKMAADFIRWVQQQEFYKNTTILVLGDHIVLGNSPVYKQKPQQSTIFNAIINPVQNIIQQPHKWTTLDIAPTVLEAIGFDSPKFGLGRSLWRTEPTLYEKYDSALDFEFNKNSKFYKKLNSLPQQSSAAENLEIGHDIRGDEISHYTDTKIREELTGLNNSFDAVWTDSLNVKITKEEEKGLCLKTEFLMVFENAAKDGSIDVIINDQKIGQWTVNKDETSPYKRKICFDDKLLAADKTAHIKFDRHSKSGNPFHYTLGLKKIVFLHE